MYCEKCGQKVNDNDLYCTNCGQKIQNSPKTTIQKPRSHKTIIIASVSIAIVITITLSIILFNKFQDNYITTLPMDADGNSIMPFDDLQGQAYDDPGQSKTSLNLNNVGFLQYLIDSDDTLIMYECEIDKNSEVKKVYVIDTGMCRTFECDTTLGELAKMTDQEIYSMLNNEYKEGLDTAIEKWKSNEHMKTAIENGDTNLYYPGSYAIRGYLFTDGTGNSIDGELLFFPQAGIGKTPYVIEDTTEDDSVGWHMNCYGTYSSRHGGSGFSREYFNTGNSTISDCHEMYNIYYLTNSSFESGTVYDSNYQGLRSKDSEWTSSDKMLCYRTNNKSSTIGLDDLSSSLIEGVDYDKKRISLIQDGSQYYEDLRPFDEVANQDWN